MGIAESKLKNPARQRRHMAKAAGVPPHLVEFLYEKFKHDCGDSVQLDLKGPEFTQILTNQLSLNDYLRFLLVFTSKLPDYWLKELFRFLDSDRNGEISCDDVKNIIVAADKVSGNENADADEHAKALFSRLDSQGAGKLSCKEFVDHAIADESIMTDLEDIRSSIRRAKRSNPS